MLSKECDLETEPNDVVTPARRQLPDVPAQPTCLLLIGVGLLVVEQCAFSLFGGRMSWLGGLAMLLLMGAGTSALLVHSARAAFANAALYRHVSHLKLDAEHKLFLSRARCIDLELQLVLDACALIDDKRHKTAAWQRVALRSRQHRVVIRILGRSVTALAALLTNATRTIARHPKSVGAKSCLRDGLRALQLCVTTMDELVGSYAAHPTVVLGDFEARLIARCDRSDLNAAVWKVVRDVLSQAHEFRHAMVCGEEVVLADQWLDDRRDDVCRPADEFEPPF